MRKREREKDKNKTITGRGCGEGRNTGKGLVKLTKVDVKGPPLLGAGQEVASLHVKIPGAHCLGAQAVKQGYLGA